MRISLFTLTRNTDHRLEEWITYHAKIGVDEFLIYLDNPNNMSVDILNQLQKEYNVVYEVLNADGAYLAGRYGDDYVDWYKKEGTPFLDAPHLVRQFKAVNTALNFFKEKYKGINHWMAFQDVDEFLVPQKVNNIKDVIKKYENLYSRIVSLDYRFEVPDNKFESYIEQSQIRRPVTHMIEHWPTRKSMVKTKYCGKVKCLHDLDQSPYLIIDDEIKLNHYRDKLSFPKESYFIRDNRALELLRL